MRKILKLSFALIILAALATPGLAYRDSNRSPSNIAPGTRFGRKPMARKPYPYLYPVNPQLWRQAQRERREYEHPPDEPPQSKPAEEEPPARKKPPIRPKFIEVN
jgi:hypothetical protein